ncbi:hypothetical protein B0A48_11030 [Cryoendolithus antarcticus]|uniref:Uncharacterized protein n=1 Tax=Cryoendolithus antarcticus TaxID=1507870 RepID=A0A1V8SZA9_9PEZI|nr:hypothetical protein B0A48_11030 [Cryoendolithus antarcticus]
MSKDLQAVWQEINDDIREEEVYRLGMATVADVRSDDKGLATKAIQDFHSLVKSSIRTLYAGWPSITKYNLRSQLLKQGHIESANVDKAIDVALCLWPGIDCTATEHDKWKRWPDHDTAYDFVMTRRFDDPADGEVDDSIARFPPKFRAARLHDISGIHIEQTYYLDQHLRFNEDTRTLMLFMDFQWLHDMLERTSAEYPAKSSVVATKPTAPQPPAAASTAQVCTCTQQWRPVADPKVDRTTALAALYEETLRSVDVLFPAWDSQTMDFVAAYQENGKPVPWFNLQDLGAQKQQSLRKFRYWRARFNELIIEFESPPKDLKRIWKDRRNPMAYWTFWLGLVIAASTLTFGLTSAVLAGLQLGRTPIPP